MSSAPRTACELLVRGGLVAADPASEAGLIVDGAIAVSRGRILAAGPALALEQAFEPEFVLGSPQHVILPGLINAHDHVRGLSAIELGIPDDGLEPWIMDLMRLPPVDAHLSTLQACIDQMASGVTTLVPNLFEGRIEGYAATVDATVSAVTEAGLRARVVLGMLDQSIVVQLAQSVRAALPAELAAWVDAWLASRRPVTLGDYQRLLAEWAPRQRDQRVGLACGPVSAHWCSDALLLEIADLAAEHGLPVHMHLLESALQRTQADATGEAASSLLRRSGLLGPRVSCAHGVHLSEADLITLAATGTSIVHNASSNLRLGNGIAPVARMRAAGINVALGLDSQTLNDDGDMLQEMRLVSLLHRRFGAGGPEPSAREVLAMATINGARALGLDHMTGSLVPGKAADLVLLHGEQLLASCFGDVDAMLEAVLARVTRAQVDSVLVDGRVVFADGRPQCVDAAAVKQALAPQLAAARQGLDERAMLVRSLVGHVRKSLADC